MANETLLGVSVGCGDAVNRPTVVVTVWQVVEEIFNRSQSLVGQLGGTDGTHSRKDAERCAEDPKTFLRRMVGDPVRCIHEVTTSTRLHDTALRDLKLRTPLLALGQVVLERLYSHFIFLEEFDGLNGSLCSGERGEIRDLVVECVAA